MDITANRKTLPDKWVWLILGVVPITVTLFLAAYQIGKICEVHELSRPLSHYIETVNDFGGLRRYQMDNYAIQNHAPVVFFGDSITDYWPLGTFFAGKGYVNRGIGGQTTEQMIVRFQQDVVDINPDVVVILAGANDIRGITGTKRVDQIEQNIRTMAELAHLHGIRVVLCSVLPVAKSVWTPAQKAKILTINAWIRNYASENQFPFVDYYDAMKDPVGNLPDALSVDGLHPSLAGYKVMAPLAEHSIEQVLKR